MEDIIDNIADFFSGKSKVTANPDPAHNINLLNETKKKIESGIFTRFLKRPTIYILEIVTYLITVILFISCFLIWNEIDNIFDTYATINLASQITVDKTLPLSDYLWVSYILLFILLLPSIICFLLGRLLTSSRKKMKVFIEVEKNIDRVIYNLTNKN